MNEKYYRIPFDAVVRVKLTTQGAHYYHKNWVGKQIHTYDPNSIYGAVKYGVISDESFKILTFPSINNATYELDLEFQLLLMAFGGGDTHKMIEELIVVPENQLIETDTHGYRDTVTLKMKKDVADRFYNLLQDIECECDVNDIEDTLEVLRQALEEYEDDRYAYVY